jgi:hypothetical protein
MILSSFVGKRAFSESMSTTMAHASELILPTARFTA